MSEYRSLNARAAGLQVAQVIRVFDGPDGIEVSGVNPVAEQVVYESLVYDGLGRLRVRPDSLVARSGVQVRIRQLGGAE